MPKLPSKAECIRDLKRTQVALYGENSHKLITRDKYREYGAVPERQWRVIFGSFQEFRRKAKLEIGKATSKFLSCVRRHSEIDELKVISEERKNWGEKYERKNNKRYQLILGFADAHGRHVDPFWLRVLIDTAERCQPDIIISNGDLYDNAEFSKFHVDPREFDLAGGLNFTNENIVAPLRSVCPQAQIDIIEANHERRLLKHLLSNSPQMQILLSDWLNLSIPDILKLNEYNVNYVAKSDLGTFTYREEAELLKKNYKVYFDCFLVYHYPNGRQKGLPGFSGHHHKHQVWMEYSHHHGPYEWHQVGCGHKRDPIYTDGDPWQNGFLLAHIDTKLKIVNIEYAPITSMAVVGGKYYYRNKNEVVTPGWK